MEKTLDQKLARLRRDPACGDFILADAKDADMAFGIAAPGRSPDTGRPFRSLAAYREQMRAIVRQGIVDIMLMSAHSNAVLTIDERLFDDSPVTPAARANDTTDIWIARGSTYATQPSRPFRSAAIDHIQAGKLDPTPEERRSGADLGLYSVTFNNDVDLDRQTLAAYREFRLEAERKGFRHFLEVFAPNALVSTLGAATTGEFLNDMIARMLAGSPPASRPIFLKIPYLGPAAVEELAAYDPTIIIGVLGGSAGTTHDAFRLIHDARRHGARAALFGRKINAADDPLAFVAMLRRIVDGEIEPADAVRAYHDELQNQGITATRPLKADLELTDTALSYSG